MRSQSSRRHVIGAAVLASASAIVGSTAPGSMAAAVRQDQPSPVGEATTPAWVFVAHTLQDPYPGEVVRPDEPPPGTRYVAAEVEVRNDSGEPLNFVSSSVRLMDGDGVEYPSGAVVGSEPLIASLNLSQGERIRGWVWYAVPEAAQIREIVYIAPAPRLVVTRPEGG